MNEIILRHLGKEDFYVKSLQELEIICNDYDINNHFGTLSMFNQIVCDYLLDTCKDFSCDLEIHIDNNEISFTYVVSNCNFNNLSSNSDDQFNTSLFVLERLSDELTFTPDNKTLTSTFHVKTKHNPNKRENNFALKKSTINYSENQNLKF